MGSGNPLKSIEKATKKAVRQTNQNYINALNKGFGLDKDNWFVVATSAVGQHETQSDKEKDVKEKQQEYKAQAKERADTASRREKAEAFAEMASTKGAPVKGKKYLGSQGVLGEEENSKRKRLGG